MTTRLLRCAAPVAVLSGLAWLHATMATMAGGFADALGWVGAVGSAPGIIADLWVELWWLALAAMAALGWLYGAVWRRAVTRGGVWTSQYIILAALSIYMVMQTMEAVIFRTLLLSAPCWLAWRWAERAVPVRGRNRQRRVHARAQRPVALAAQSVERV